MRMQKTWTHNIDQPETAIVLFNNVHKTAPTLRYESEGRVRETKVKFPKVLDKNSSYLYSRQDNNGIYLICGVQSDIIRISKGPKDKGFTFFKN